MDPDDIAGLVVSVNGPEAGVWVIAETNNLPMKFVRIVVTNEEGRYVLPDLPNVSYEVFARGNGFVDSRRVKVWPGQQLFIGLMAAEEDGNSAASSSRPQGMERNLVMTMWESNGSIPPDRNSLPGDQPGPSPLPTSAEHGALGNDAARASLNRLETGDIKTLLSGIDLRVPYPKGSFSSTVQSRVDDDAAGWKGRGVWSTFTVGEPDGNGTARRLLKLQVRPDPLSR